MLRGFATINYWAADLAAAREWYSELLGTEPYFERAELEGRIIGPDDPDYHRGRLGYVEFRIGDYQHELGLIDSRYRCGWVRDGRGLDHALTGDVERDLIGLLGSSLFGAIS